MDIINSDIQVNNAGAQTGFKATCPSAHPPTATIVFRIEHSGKVEEMLTDPAQGIVRLNEWDIEPGQLVIKCLKVDGKDSGVRHLRVACSEAVVDGIKSAGGSSLLWYRDGNL